jgi:peptidoglycan/LPS O-acetylase OafA/YrhL
MAPIKAVSDRVLKDYIPEIDGLRALAVLLVFVHHLRPSWLPGGFIGVDVFFVISGYVVSKSLAAVPNQPLGPYLASFYARRIIRILPALLVCLGVTLIATLLFIPHSWLSESIPQTGMWALFGAANIALMRTNDGYFAPRAEFNPFTQTWSLGVEEQFYLLFPLMFFIWMRLRSSPRTILRYIAWGVIAIAVLGSLIAAAIFSVQNADRGYYSLLSRFWELGAGALLFQFHYWITALRPACHQTMHRLTSGLLILGLGLISVGAYASQPAQTPYPLGILPVVGTLCILQVLGLSQSPGSHLTQWLASAPARGLGRLSYSLYLWHWPVIVLMRWTVGIEHPEQILQAAILSCWLALLSYYGIERPIRTNRFIKGLRHPVQITVGLVMVLLVLSASSIAVQHQHQLSLSTTRDAEDWYPDAVVSPKTSNLSLPLAGKAIFVVGNSHATAYRQMLMQVQTQLGLRAVIDDQQLCSMGLLSAPVQERPGCLQVHRSYLERLRQEAHGGDLVFLASSRLPRLSDQWTPATSEAALLQAVHSAEAQAVRALGLAETVQLIAQIQAMGLRVMIDLPKPVFKSPPFRCADWFNAHNPVCAPGFDVQREFITQARQPMVDQISQLQRRRSGLVIWDPLPILCPDAICHAFKHGKPLFFDGDHLSGYGNRMLTKSFVQVLSGIWPEQLSRP